MVTSFNKNLGLSGGINTFGVDKTPTDWAAVGQGMVSDTGGGRKRRGRKRRRNITDPLQTPTAQGPATYDEQNRKAGPGGPTGGTTPGGSSPIGGPTTGGATPQGLQGQGKTTYPNASGAPLDVEKAVGPFANVSGPGIEMFGANPDMAYSYGLGIPADSYAGGWYGSTYNPSALGQALGRDVSSPTALVNFGNLLASQFTGQGGMGQMADPQSLVASLFAQATQAYGGKPSENNPLAMISSEDPGTAFSDFMQILEGAVKPLMTETGYNAMIATITHYAKEYMTQWAQHPPEDEARSGSNIIRYIQSHLGPGFGM